MTTPDFVLVTLTATLLDVTGAPITGVRPSIRLSGPASNRVADERWPTTVRCAVNVEGVLTQWDGDPIVLPALDVLSDGTTLVDPQGLWYEMGGLPGATRPFKFVITAAMAPTVDIAELPPVTPGVPVFVVTGPAGPQGAPSPNVDGGTPTSTYIFDQIISGGTP